MRNISALQIFRRSQIKFKMNLIGGAVTVEAALVLPVFLCIIISVLFLIKTVYTHETIQHALTETAGEMASAGYILHISGIGDLNNGLESGMESRAQVFKDHMDTFFESFNSLGGLFRAGEVIDTIAADPLDELKHAACLVAGGVYDDLKTQLFTPMVKICMEKYLVSGSSQNADNRLRALNIQGGLTGLDFSESKFLTDENNEIDIVVKYKINLPVPIKVFPDINMVQRACVKAWMGGDEASSVIVDGNAGDIWNLDNFSRGRKIRTIFGANLPFNFPLIAKFENGVATMIKSMDITAESYKDTVNISKTLDEYLSALYSYNGQKEPWGSGKIIIKPQDIEKKELLLVIPENQLDKKTEALLAKIAGNASLKGIKLVINRYGLKNIKTH